VHYRQRKTELTQTAGAAETSSGRKRHDRHRLASVCRLARVTAEGTGFLILEHVFHLSQSPHGGLDIGLGDFGRAVWAQREPYVVTTDDAGDQVVIVSHRWSFWCTRAPKGIAAQGHDCIALRVSANRGGRCRVASRERRPCGHRPV
jgi:hypothetical protein